MYKFVNIFKTTILSTQDMKLALDTLYAFNIPLQATVDLLDEDKVLRVASDFNLTDRVQQQLEERNFLCEVMETYHLGEPLV
ncbi:hypothetical protein ACL9RF_14145 [Sphingobacterium sp. Mn56C]|uniref:hypothetical protein n=1 Tax=Sphingobacterium sp. Mn56C TaxID=3395261 RepID=UPI003BE3BCD5